MADLTNLKPGDEVAIVCCRWGTSITKVEKVTKLHIITERGIKWKTTGYPATRQRFNTQHLEIVTPKMRKALLAGKRRRAVARYEWSKAPQELIDAVQGLIEHFEKLKVKEPFTDG